jgi:hypothetical protein
MGAVNRHDFTLRRRRSLKPSGGDLPLRDCGRREVPRFSHTQSKAPVMALWKALMLIAIRTRLGAPKFTRTAAFGTTHVAPFPHLNPGSTPRTGGQGEHEYEEHHRGSIKLLSRLRFFHGESIFCTKRRNLVMHHAWGRVNFLRHMAQLKGLGWVMRCVSNRWLSLFGARHLGIRNQRSPT